MFTGLVDPTGRVAAIEPRSGQVRLRIAPDKPMAPYTLGESIAVNGACLTVETHGDDWFTAYASAETMSRTNLGNLTVGSQVNLERALAMGDRLGGHLVSGHVDCIAEVASTAPAGESTIYRLVFPGEYGSQVISKGSVALDGISLTVNNCGSDFLEVNIIPATQRETTISGWQPGYRVNMETDLIGKYVERMLGAWKGDGPAGGTKKPAASNIDEDFLRKHGF